MESIQRINGDDKIAEHPIIVDLQTKVRLILDLVERMHERQEHLIAQNDILVAQIKAGGLTGATED